MRLADSWQLVFVFESMFFCITNGFSGNPDFNHHHDEKENILNSPRDPAEEFVPLTVTEEVFPNIVSTPTVYEEFLSPLTKKALNFLTKG